MPNVFHTKEEMIDCVNAFYEGMVQRSEEMKQHPNYKTGENYAYLGLPPCFLIFDEYVAFFEMLGVKESTSLLSQLKENRHAGTAGWIFPYRRLSKTRRKVFLGRDKG